MKTVNTFSSIDKTNFETVEQRQYKMHQRIISNAKKALAAKKAAQAEAKAARKLKRKITSALSNNAETDLGGSMRTRKPMEGAPQAPQSLDLSKDEIYTLQGTGLYTDEDGIPLGFSVSDVEAIEARDKDIALGTAQAYLEAYCSDLPKETLSDDLAPLVYEQVIDEGENFSGYNTGKDEPEIVIQTSFINKAGELCRKNFKKYARRIAFSDYDLTGLEDITSVGTAESFSLDSFFEMEGRIVKSINKEALHEVLLDQGLFLGPKIIVENKREVKKQVSFGPVDKNGDLPPSYIVYNKKGEMVIEESQSQRDGECYYYTSSYTYTDKYGVKCQGQSTDEVRVIIQMNNVNEIEDEKGNEIGFSEFFNLEIKKISCRKSSEDEVTVYVPEKGSNHLAFFQDLKEGKVMKKTVSYKEEIVGYKTIGVRSKEINRKFVPLRTTELMTHCYYGVTSVPVAIVPIVEKKKVVSLVPANTVLFYTPKSTNETERFFAAREEAIAVIDSEISLCVRRNTKEISALAALRTEDNDLIQVGRASTHAPSWLASLDGAWEERKTLLKEEKLTEHYSKKSAAAKQGRINNVKKYYSKLIEDNKELVSFLPAIDGTDTDVLEGFLERKGLSPALVIKVATALKKEDGVARLNRKTFRALFSLKTKMAKAPTAKTKTGAKRKAYSDIEQMIFDLNDDQKRDSVLTSLKGKAKKVQQVLAVAAEEMKQSQADRKAVKELQAKGEKVSNVLSKDYAILQRNVYFHLTKMVS